MSSIHRAARGHPPTSLTPPRVVADPAVERVRPAAGPPWRRLACVPARAGRGGAAPPPQAQSPYVTPATHFRASATRTGCRLAVQLAGDLDLATVGWVSALLDPLLEAERPRALVFDLEQVSFVDLDGFGLLVEYRNDGLDAGYGVELVNLNARTRRLLRRAHLDAVFTVDPT